MLVYGCLNVGGLRIGLLMGVYYCCLLVVDCCVVFLDCLVILWCSYFGWFIRFSCLFCFDLCGMFVVLLFVGYLLCCLGIVCLLGINCYIDVVADFGDCELWLGCLDWIVIWLCECWVLAVCTSVHLKKGMCFVYGVNAVASDWDWCFWGC